MLSLKKMGHGSEDYYLGLAGYYLGRRRPVRPGGGDGDDDGEGPFGPDGQFDPPPELPNEPAGQWLGRGAGALGLFGIVLPEELKPLMQGYHPWTGQPLVQNAGAANRSPGWDFTFSAPKTVSIVWSQAEEPLRLRIESGHRAALVRTIGLAEDLLAFSRTGRGGYGYQSAKLAVASFEHATSRSGDPQLHTHCLVLNVAVDETGATRALFSRPLYVNRDLLGAYYRAELAKELRALGFRLRKHDASFEIVGVPDELVAAYSTRRLEILAHLATHGRSGGVAAAEAALATRRPKTDFATREELFLRWQEQNAHYGFSDVNDLLYDPSRHRRGSAQQAIETSVRRLSAQASHFSRTDFLEATLQEAPALGLDPLELLRAANDFADGAEFVKTQTTASLVSVGVHDGQQRFTTEEVLEEEQQLLDAVERLRQRPGATVPAAIVEWAVEEQLRDVAKKAKRAGKTLKRPPQLSAEQRIAVEHLTQDAQGTGGIRILQGLAGTGKTDFALGVAKRAWEEAGYEVLAATPTAKAGKVLERDTGMDAQTVTKALGDYELPWGCVLRHHLRQLKNAALGKRTYPLARPKPIEVGPKTILVVDEAGMLDTRHTFMLAQQVVKGGGTLVLSGDAQQLPPVGRGAPFASLVQRIGAVELTDIQRQQEAWARQVATHAAKGEVKEALAILAEKNSIEVSESVDEAAQQLVRRWTAQGGISHPTSLIVLANTNEETEALNRLCQQERLRAGAISAAQSVEVRDIDQENGRTYVNRVHVGDQVLFTRNSKNTGVENGTLGTVLAIQGLTGTLSVRLANGGIVLIPAKNFPHIRLGYSVTTYKAQGDTYPQALVLVSESQASQPSFYVSVTRAKESTTIFTTKALWNPAEQPVHQAILGDLLSRAPDLRLASDLMQKAAARGGLDAATLPPLEIRRVPPAATVADARAAEPSSGSPPVTNKTDEVGTAPATPLRETVDPIAVASDLASPPAESAPAPGGDAAESPLVVPTNAGFVAVPAAEVLSWDQDEPPPSRPRKRRRGRPVPTQPHTLDPATPPAKRKRKKRRAGDVDSPWDDAPLAEAMAIELAEEPGLDSTAVDAVHDHPESTDEVTPALLPDDFFAVPIPSIDAWEPGPPVAAEERVGLLPRDFFTTPVAPTARAIPSRVRTPRKPRPDRAEEPPERAAISMEEARSPAVKERLRKEARRKAIASARADHGVPADKVEIISVEQWEEAGVDCIIVWTRITYRITTYGSGDLVDAVAYPVML